MAGKNYDINFRIKTDAKPTRKELEMTVAEFKDFNKTVRASQTPLDRFEKDLSDLNKTFKAGGITADQYEHRLKDIESRYSKATVQQKKFKTGVNGLSNALKNMVVSYAAFSTVQKGFRAVREEMERIDRFGKQAAGLGATTEFLSGLEFAAQRTSGLAIGAATKGIEKMTRRIEEAALGTGEAIKALEMLGLEAKALASLNPEEQFQVLSRAMDKVTDAGERTLIATKLFDDGQSKLHTTMALTNKEYQDQIDLAKELGKITTKAAADKAGAYINSIQRRDAALAKATKTAAMNEAFFNPLSAGRQTERFNTLADFMSSEKGVGEKAGMAAKEGLQFLPILQLVKLIKYAKFGSSGVTAEGRDLSSRTLSKSEVIALEKKNADDKAKLEQDAFNKLWAESAEKKKKVDFYQAQLPKELPHRPDILHGIVAARYQGYPDGHRRAFPGNPPGIVQD